MTAQCSPITYRELQKTEGIIFNIQQIACINYELAAFVVSLLIV